ncbi:hypothetical protein F5Y18DRAFT_431401 [Xylariaceae sp. FL1019]|nr:hypothetical protein F5Y18DRAFT_431401 [Xylariaceae sp. FL1019]
MKDFSRVSETETVYWGWPFHPWCWDILLKVYGKNAIDLRSWFNFCRSFPLNEDQVLDWGHDYGLGKVAGNPLPPQEVVFELTYENYSLCKRNPLEVPELRKQVLFNYMKSSLREASTGQCSSSVEQEDCCNDSKGIASAVKPPSRTLEGLPSEIRELILTLLPTDDTLNLRLASRAFAALGFSSTFWRSRFCTPMEFRHFFEVWDLSEEQKLDWGVFYRYAKKLCATGSNSRRSLINRSRIWDNACLLRNIIDRAARYACLGRVENPMFSTELTARGYICKPNIQFNFGSRVLESRSLSIAAKITNVYVSFVRLPDGDFISGLRFILADKSIATTGYARSDFEIEIEWNEQKLNNGKSRPAIARKLIGFEFAVNLKGIRGISALDASGKISKWAGECEGLVRKLLLNQDKTAMQISCQFDFLKMITLSLSASSNLEVVREMTNNKSTIMQLRTTSMWYPRVPPGHTKFYNLAKTEGTKQNRPDSTYTLNLFGGDNGEKLKCITEFVVYITGGFHIRGIEARYSDNSTASTLGFCRLSTDTPAVPSTPQDQAICVPINGPAGERLQIIEVKQRQGWDTTEALKFVTNQHKTYVIGHKLAIESTNSKWRMLDTNDEQIIGFYSERIGGIPCLGVITMSPMAKSSAQTGHFPGHTSPKGEIRSESADFGSRGETSVSASCRKRKSVPTELGLEPYDEGRSLKTSKAIPPADTSTKDCKTPKPSQLKTKKKKADLIKPGDTNIWSGRLRQRKLNPDYRA